MSNKANITDRAEQKSETLCYHCGDSAENSIYEFDQHHFCCLGCQSVYQILNQHDMHYYYKQNQFPGKNPQLRKEHYEFLDEDTIADTLIDFKNEEISIVTFYIPSIHCSSCIWLLEKLYKFNPAILQSRSDFMKKQLSITFKHQEISLRKLVELLVQIGYEPKITLQDVVKEGKKTSNRSLIRKIAVAGFCFGNSMMLSFPEYFGMASFEKQYSQFFGYINLAFGIPVLLYSARDYFRSAWQSIKQKQLNLDVPLALGIFILFVRTAHDVITQSGPGFADTLCGLVFFILIGKWVQQKTYYHISFERDYRSYFPVAVTKIEENGEKSISISDLKVGDRIQIRNNEIIPADAILLKGHAEIDFSFVTGESSPVHKVLGEVIYAGGKQTREMIELEITKPVSQSYLTRLWNQDNFKAHDHQFRTFSNTVSQYFTWVLLGIAISASGYWLSFGQLDLAWGAFTAVLIIACPCALALSSPFTLSAALSVFDRNGFYVKNTASVEQMAVLDTLVFDKTGTISSPNASKITFQGSLSELDKKLILSLCRNSGHPLSREIVAWIGPMSYSQVENYNEIIGKGLKGEVLEHQIQVGSAEFLDLNFDNNLDNHKKTSKVFVKINQQNKGYFELHEAWRKDLSQVLNQLAERYNLHLVSGDHASGIKNLKNYFPENSKLLFQQMPQEKLDFIKGLQESEQQVAMIGDGLNDAGALKQANLGIAVSDDVNNFSPGCDAILDGKSFEKLPQFFKFAKDAMKVIHRSFGIALAYNVVGLSFAVQGTMSPLFAAILMPLSTVTIISFTSLMTHYFASKNGLKIKN